MPDDRDYEWLARLLARPERWSGDDLRAARAMLTNQQRALAELHPKDRAGRESAQELVAALEGAIRSHIAGGT